MKDKEGKSQEMKMESVDREVDAWVQPRNAVFNIARYCQLDAIHELSVRISENHTRTAGSKAIEFECTFQQYVVGICVYVFFFS